MSFFIDLTSDFVETSQPQIPQRQQPQQFIQDQNRENVHVNLFDLDLDQLNISEKQEVQKQIYNKQLNHDELEKVISRDKNQLSIESTSPLEKKITTKTTFQKDFPCLYMTKKNCQYYNHLSKFCKHPHKCEFPFCLKYEKDCGNFHECRKGGNHDWSECRDYHRCTKGENCKYRQCREFHIFDYKNQIQLSKQQKQENYLRKHGNQGNHMQNNVQSLNAPQQQSNNIFAAPKRVTKQDLLFQQLMGS